MKNLLVRTATGSLYVTVVLASVLFHPVLFCILLSVFAFFSIRELHPMVSPGKFPVLLSSVLTFLLLSGLIISFYPAGPVNDGFISILLMIILIPLYFLYSGTKNSILVPGLFIVYIILPLYLLNQLHLQSWKQEVPYTLSVFIFIWVNDSFAYLSGMAFGKHKLMPRISPSKTWEGFAGGVLFTLVASYLFSLKYQGMNTAGWLLLGLLVAIAAVFGDLFESFLKRSAGVKDSGKLLPGHGGILDRIDSLLLVSPVVYMYLLITK